MADAKDCPKCGLINPPNAQRCDCGYDFVAKQVRGSFLTGTSAGCQSCGAEAETRHVSFHQNIGVLVLRLHSSVQGHLCQACIEREFWGKTMTTLFLGWWGIISFFVTPFVLLFNIMGYLLCLRMTPPPVRVVGRRIVPGPGHQPRLGQLVGLNCVHCGERIPSEFDGRFCQECSSPVHNGCARAGANNGCKSCGSVSPTS